MEVEGPLISLWGIDLGRFIWFCAGGDSFFVGVGLLVVAMLIPIKRWKIWGTAAVYGSGLVGICLIILSVPAISWFIIIPWAIGVLAFLVLAVIRGRRAEKVRGISKIAVGALCITAVAAETPFHVTAAMPEGTYSRLYVVGDSVSAGIGRPDDPTWPALVEQEHGVEVINLAKAGATVNSAIRQAEQVDGASALVLLEIGGNDLFAPTPLDDFERDLRTVIETSRRHGGAVVMLELPLLPVHIGYGRIQRQLAAEYGIGLVPKRFLAGVFGTPGATMDLAHLTPMGYELMAEKVWELLGGTLGCSGSEKTGLPAARE